MVTAPTSPMSSLTMLPLMILLSFASHHIQLMPSKVSDLALAPTNTESTPLALDVLGFSQFKHYYAQVLDDHMHDNFGAMNKQTFLQAIEKPFIKSFTVENIKKSFELVGLHPFNPSPVKAMKVAFTSLLDHATLPVPSFPSLHHQPDPSPSTSAPPPMASMDSNDPFILSQPTTDEPDPQKVAQTLLQGTSASWIVSNNPITSSVTFDPYCTPSAPSIRAGMPPHTSSHHPPDLMAENTALWEHISKLNHIIASQRVQLTLNGLAVRKLKHQLYEKEQRAKGRARQHLFDGRAQITTAPEFRKLVKDMQEKNRLEKEQKEVWAEERKKKADANAALGDWKARLVERYNEDMASYNEECATLAADGVPKKLWPKKPTHPT